MARSSLMPNLNGALRETVQQTNLRAMGIRINLPFPGVAIPSDRGPVQLFRPARHADAERLPI